MRNIRTILQHHFNAMHIYCTLCRVGLQPARARRLAQRWERVRVYRKLYR